MIVESDGSGNSEHSYSTSEIEEFIQNYENHEATTEEEEGDIQNVCEKDEEQGLSQLHLAAQRGDKEAVKRLLKSSANGQKA